LPRWEAPAWLASLSLFSGIAEWFVSSQFPNVLKTHFEFICYLRVSRLSVTVNRRSKEDKPMVIAIHARGFSLTDAIEEHVHKRLGYTLARGGDRIGRVVVRLSDLNGPRGGIDKRCLIEIRLDGLPAVVVEDIQSDLYAAIDRAAGRAGRTINRRLALDSSRRSGTVAMRAHRPLAGL
jgi:putative sigma-54 modulation protein